MGKLRVQLYPILFLIHIYIVYCLGGKCIIFSLDFWGLYRERLDKYWQD